MGRIPVTGFRFHRNPVVRPATGPQGLSPESGFAGYTPVRVGRGAGAPFRSVRRWRGAVRAHDYS